MHEVFYLFTLKLLIFSRLQTYFILFSLMPIASAGLEICTLFSDTGEFLKDQSTKIVSKLTLLSMEFCRCNNATLKSGRPETAAAENVRRDRK